MAVGKCGEKRQQGDCSGVLRWPQALGAAGKEDLWLPQPFPNPGGFSEISGASDIQLFPLRRNSFFPSLPSSSTLAPGSMLGPRILISVTFGEKKNP